MQLEGGGGLNPSLTLDFVDPRKYVSLAALNTAHSPGAANNGKLALVENSGDPTEDALYISDGSTWEVAISSDIDALKKSADLSDVASATTSRTNLGVDSSAEVTTKVDGKMTTHEGASIHTDIALNTTHRGSDGSGHVDVVANTTHRGRTDDPHSVTKAQVGLSNVADLKVKLDATVAPGVTDDSNAGYAVLSRWADVTAGKEYVALDVSVGAAVWIETTGAGGGGFYTDTNDYVISPAATITVDRANGEVHNILLNRASTDVNVLSNIPNGATITLNATSDGTAGRLIVFSAAGVEYVGGVEPIKTSAANSKDIFEIKKTSSAPKFLIKHLANIS